MRQIVKGRTVLVIAHRLSTVRGLDRIVTLDGGRVVEEGTHDALIATGGRYASLYRLQAGIHVR
jgi:subfamily B ATP-binding cassette protein HlyB/CyaB